MGLVGARTNGHKVKPGLQITLDSVIPVFSAGRRNALAVCLVGRDSVAVANAEACEASPRVADVCSHSIGLEVFERGESKADQGLVGASRTAEVWP